MNQTLRLCLFIVILVILAGMFGMTGGLAFTFWSAAKFVLAIIVLILVMKFLL